MEYPQEESTTELNNFVNILINDIPKGHYHMLSTFVVTQAKRAVNGILRAQGRDINEVPTIDNALVQARMGSWTALNNIDKKSLLAELKSLTIQPRQASKPVTPVSRGSARQEPKRDTSSRSGSLRGGQRQEMRSSHSRSSEDKRVLIAKQEAEINQLRDRLKSSGEGGQSGQEMTNTSDINTPTKIAEHFRKLFKEEWKSAMDDLLRKRPNTEKESIILLSDLLKEIYHMTFDRAHSTLKEIATSACDIMINPMTTRAQVDGIIVNYHTQKNETKLRVVILSECDNPPKLPRLKRTTINPKVSQDMEKVFQQYASNCLRSAAEVVVPLIQKEVHERYSDLMKNFGVRKYLYESARLTWLMNVQDPPLALEWAKEGDRFLHDLFKEYMKQGSIVDFCVWPVLLSCENGDVMSRGVVQPR